MSNQCERNPQPCLNQGTCVWNGGANCTCLCSNGYTDHNRQTGLFQFFLANNENQLYTFASVYKGFLEVGACDSVVCYNGGTCIDRLALLYM